MINSLAASLASKPTKQIKAALAKLSDDECEELCHDWRFWGRENQIEPPGEWLYWLFLAGRGAGKTRAGSEWVRDRVRNGCSRIGLIAPTARDARTVMVEGESGLLSVCWEGDRDQQGNITGRPFYEPSKARVSWENGAQAFLYSAEEPERLRGPQHDAIWCDELAAWKYLRDTWDMAQFGLRLGAAPRAMITTTPKPVSLVKELLTDAGTVISRGSTFDNAANLAPAFLAAVRERYEGTRIGRQELYAEILEEAEGALWSRQMIDETRVKEAPEMQRVVVALDPATTAKEKSDETGIVIAGLGTDGRGYILADASGRYSPRDWARKAIKSYEKHGGDRIVAEGNQGGDMVRHTLQTEWPAAPVKIVHASRGKQARAEPVVALYEQGKISHVGHLPDLEDQLVNWAPLTGAPSPDRLDAMVWAITELMVGGTPSHAFW